MKPHHNTGRIHTPEHNAKISASLKALHRLPWNTGKHLPADMRAKIAAAGRGRRHSEETKQKMRVWHLAHSPVRGKKLSPQHIALVSQRLKGRKFTAEHRARISKALRGEKSKWWKGGITSTNNLIRNSTAYKEWRTAVFRRDDYRCFDCGQRGGQLEVHHVYAFALYTRLRLVLENGITLCRECHDKTKRKGARTYSYSIE